MDKKILEHILYSLPGNIVCKDTKGIFTYCNKNLLDFFGLKSEKEIVGKTDYDFVSRKHAEIIRAQDKEIVEIGIAKSYELEAPGKNEEPVVYLTEKTPLYDSDNNIMGVLAISFDITERKQLEEKLKLTQKESEETKSYLKTIIELMPCHVYWKDKKGRLLGCNKQQAKVFGYNSPQEMIGKTAFHCPNRTVQQAEAIANNDKHVLTTGKPLTLEESSNLADGTKSTCLSYKVPLRDNDGKITGIIGLSFDITKRKEKEQTLQKAKEKADVADKMRKEFLKQMSQEITGLTETNQKTIKEYATGIKSYFDNLIDNMPGNVYWQNKDGVFLGCNKNLANMHKLESRNDYIGKTYEDFFERDLASKLRNIDNEIMEQDKPRTLEEINTKKGKPVATYLTRKTPLHDENGEVIGLLGVSIDITEQKQLEQEIQDAKLKEKIQKEQLQAVQATAASIAHELRTPLRSIDNNAQIKARLDILLHGYELAKEADLPVEFLRPVQIAGMRDALDDIQKETQYAHSIINSLLLNIKNLDANNNDFKVYSITKCVDKTIQRYPFNSADQERLIHWNANHDFQFNGDSLLVTHILFNLLKNAIYYVEKAGKGDIKINLKPGKNWNELYFKDTGMGMSEYQVEHIFDQFFSDTEGGTGIGLTFCKMAMHNMNGKITCHAKAGEFTEFVLKFPVL